MLKFDRKKKKLVIPVGINPSFGNDTSTLYNVSDADVVANDILEGKIAYGSEGKVVGTLDLESEKATSYNEGYQDGESDGYQEGLENGYQNGFDNGIIEQKRLLTNITITENGTYTREDGYNEVVVEVPDLNGDYNEGYQAGESAGYNNGYNNGYNSGYNEGNQDGYDNGYRVGNTDGVAIGREEIITEQNDANITSTDVVEGKIGYSKNNTKIVGNLNIQTIKDASYNQGYSEGYGAGESAGIEEGKQEIISGMDDATITPSTVIKGEIGYGKNNEKIVGEFEYVEGFNFGKIGYSQELSNVLNSITTEKIAYSKQLYDAWDPNRTSARGYFQNNTSLVYAPNVNCSNIVNGCQSMFNGCERLTSVPALNTSNCLYFGNMFYYCKELTTVGLIDTSSAKSLERMFYYCPILTSVPHLNTSNVTNMNSMFSNCSKLTSVPHLNTSNVTNMSNMFAGCNQLTSIPQFDTSNVTTMYEMFSYCSNLTSVPLLNCEKVNACTNAFINCSNLVDVDGFQDLGKGFGKDYNVFSFRNSTKLTRQSCLNIFNTIYDMNLVPNATAAKIIELTSTTKALLSDEDIAIATSKGWTIS